MVAEIDRMMNSIFSPQGIGSIGLVLDIIGALLLFRYGLPQEVSRSGYAVLIAEGYPESEEAERKKARHYDRMGHLGLGLLVFGFVLQLVGNLIQLLD